MFGIHDRGTGSHKSSRARWSQLQRTGGTLTSLPEVLATEASTRAAVPLEALISQVVRTRRGFAIRVASAFEPLLDNVESRSLYQVFKQPRTAQPRSATARCANVFSRVPLPIACCGRTKVACVWPAIRTDCLARLLAADPIATTGSSFGRAGPV